MFVPFGRNSATVENISAPESAPHEKNPGSLFLPLHCLLCCRDILSEGFNSHKSLQYLHNMGKLTNTYMYEFHGAYSDIFFGGGEIVFWILV